MSSTIADVHADQRRVRAVGQKAVTMRLNMLGFISMLAADAQPPGKIPRVGVLTAVTGAHHRAVP
jgi:hypothetical protein